MKKSNAIFILGIIFISLASVRAEQLMFIEMNCKINSPFYSFDIQDIVVRPTGDSYFLFQGQTEYNLKIYGVLGNLIYTEPVLLPEDKVFEGEEIPACSGAEGETFVVVARYDPHALSVSLEKTIAGFPVPIVLATRSLTDVADFRGDGVCQRWENSQSSPGDCPASGTDGYCNNVADGVCDTDCLAIALDTDPFILDYSDCTPASLADLSCDGSLGCYGNSAFSCYFDKNMQKRYLRKLVCNRPGESCNGGQCVGAIQKVDNYLCKTNADCVVNGEQWSCNCGKCYRPGSFVGERCCFVNPN